MYRKGSGPIDKRGKKLYYYRELGMALKLNIKRCPFARIGDNREVG